MNNSLQLELFGQALMDYYNGDTEAMLDYVRPLVQGEVPITIGDDGVPVFMRFDRKPLEKKLAKYL